MREVVLGLILTARRLQEAAHGVKHQVIGENSILMRGERLGAFGIGAAIVVRQVHEERHADHIEGEGAGAVAQLHIFSVV